MSKILEGLDGVLCHMDDVLIMGTNKREHDERLITAVLERLQNAGVTLNPAKCQFGWSSVKLLGNIIDYRRRADPTIYGDGQSIRQVLSTPSRDKPTTQRTT